MEEKVEEKKETPEEKIKKITEELEQKNKDYE